MYIYIYIRIYLYAFMYVSVYTHTHTHARTRTHTHAHLYIIYKCPILVKRRMWTVYYVLTCVSLPKYDKMSVCKLV